MDVVDKQTRSRMMANIRAKNTKPEIIVRSLLHQKGFRFRLHDKKFPGKPDIVLPKYKTIIEIQGCFWHGHENCKYFNYPKNNRKFWKTKIKRTAERDKINHLMLHELGWNLIIIWECQLKNDKLNFTLDKLINLLRTQ